MNSKSKYIKYGLLTLIIIGVFGWIIYCSVIKLSAQDDVVINNISFKVKNVATNNALKNILLEKGILLEDNECYVLIYPDSNTNYLPLSRLIGAVQVFLLEKDFTLIKSKIIKPNNELIKLSDKTKYIVITRVPDDDVEKGINISIPGRVAVMMPEENLKIDKEEVFLEIAETPELRRLGLMFRKELPENAGMIFVYDINKEMNFWMKNTSVPLSICFIDDKLKVVNIKTMSPFDLTSISSEKPVRFALEMNKGWFKKHNIKPGMEIKLPRSIVNIAGLKH